MSDDGTFASLLPLTIPDPGGPASVAGRRIADGKDCLVVAARTAVSLRIQSDVIPLTDGVGVVSLTGSATVIALDGAAEQVGSGQVPSLQFTNRVRLAGHQGRRRDVSDSRWQDGRGNSQSPPNVRGEHAV